MKTSIIIPTYNEEKNIKKLIDSIITQTHKINEVIIVDGGSTDKTIEIIKDYSKIKLYIKPNYNIAKARNYGIKKSTGEIIFTADSSTKLHKDYIKTMLNGFDAETDIVFGRWKIVPTNKVEKFLVSRTPDWNNINTEDYIPSNRHVAMKKSVWKKVGGWPEHLRRADDNFFHLKAHSLGLKYKYLKKALVNWYPDRNLKDMIKLAFLDSKTEGLANIHLKRKNNRLILLSLMIWLTTIFTSIFLSLTFLWMFIGFFIGVSLSKGGERSGMIFSGTILFIILYLSHSFGLITGIIQRRLGIKTEEKLIK